MRNLTHPKIHIFTGVRFTDIWYPVMCNYSEIQDIRDPRGILWWRLFAGSLKSTSSVIIAGAVLYSPISTGDALSSYTLLRLGAIRCLGA